MNIYIYILFINYYCIKLKPVYIDIFSRFSYVQAFDINGFECIIFHYIYLYCYMFIFYFLLTIIIFHYFYYNFIRLFVAGILDTSFAWISNNSSSSLGPRVFEAGYDVYLANFRGTDGHNTSNNRKRHKKYTVNDNEYWDFNVDDLSLDVRAFVQVYILHKFLLFSRKF